MLNLKKNVKNIYLIGIGGIGVSAIAEILINKNYNIFGSDLKKSFNTKKLSALGATIFYEHNEKNINTNIDLLIYTSAINSENKELKKAHSLNIPCYSRAEILGIIMKDFSNNIAISGTHGKTTTTSMISLIINNAKLSPTALIGGNLKEFGGNAIIGNGDILITEACEYKENFLFFNPTTVAILNIDEDHLDYYKDINHIASSFKKFANLVPDKIGKVFINSDDKNSQKIIPNIKANIITFGINNTSDYTAKNLTFNTNGFSNFDVFYKDELISNFNLSLPGNHNIYNSLAAIAIAHNLDINTNVIKETLKTFKNAERRFQIIGDFNDATIIDDYAHHPTEIKATLEATKKIDHNRVICIFQPHTYTRTKELLIEFSNSFSNSDITIITKIYAARETDIGIVNSKDLVKLIEKNGEKAIYLNSFEEIVEYVKSIALPGDIIFTMGAGNISNLGKLIIK